MIIAFIGYIIHVDCSKWYLRRLLAEVIASSAKKDGHPRRHVT